MLRSVKSVFICVPKRSYTMNLAPLGRTWKVLDTDYTDYTDFSQFPERNLRKGNPAFIAKTLYVRCHLRITDKDSENVRHLRSL